jgi:transposase
MSKVTVFVGLDYHQNGVQVCVLDKQGNLLANGTRPNDWQEIAAVVPPGAVVFAAIEACCGAANLAEELINRAGWSVHLAHAGYVARMKQGPDKTDCRDARLLADLERVGYLPKVWLAPESIRQLRRLVRYRQQLSQQRRNVKLRVRALLRDQRVRPPAEFNPWTKAWHAWLGSCEQFDPATNWILQQHLQHLETLKTQLREAEKKLAEATCDDPVVRVLLAQEGVGLITAVTLRAEIGRFDRFRTGKQLARFCSVSPRNASSGDRQADAGLIRAGSPELRRVLMETAHRLAWRSDRWVQFSARLKERGKPRCVVIAAIANRWIRGLYYDMKTNDLNTIAA